MGYSLKTMVTTRAAAETLGVSVARVKQLVASGRLQATKLARDWLIDPESLEALATEMRPPGRHKAAES